MKRLSAIIFDLDGTLIDSSEAIVECVNYALAGKGFLPADPRLVQRSIGTSLEETFSMFTDTDPAELVKLYREQYGRVVLGKTALLPGVEEALRKARTRGYRLALATTKPAYFAEPILDNLGIRALFEVIGGGDEVPRLKPSPDLLRLVLARLGCTTDEAVYVGDHPVDVAAANAAGVDIICVATGFWSRGELEELKPIAVADDLSQLLSLLPDRAGDLKADPEKRCG
jgi:phosphoglycolate phosphatase